VFTVLPRYAQQLRHLQGFAQVAAARIGHGVAQLQWKFQQLPPGSKRWIRGGSEHQLSFFWGLEMFDCGLICIYIYTLKYGILRDDDDDVAAADDDDNDDDDNNDVDVDDADDDENAADDENEDGDDDNDKDEDYDDDDDDDDDGDDHDDHDDHD
jgi:hypothetical protein